MSADRLYDAADRVIEQGSVLLTGDAAQQFARLLTVAAAQAEADEYRARVACDETAVEPAYPPLVRRLLRLLDTDCAFTVEGP